MDKITIAGKNIGRNYRPFIVAEMSANHNQSLEKALAIVDAAANAGVHAVKLQTYTPDTLTIDEQRDEFVISDAESLWNGQSLYKLYREAHMPWEWHKPLFDRCRKWGIFGFSTPFDETAVDFLEDLNVPAYKIASFENNHLPLIRKAASTGKPLIMSIGMATISEIDEAVKTAREAGNKNIILLECTSSYPAVPQDANLLTIPDLRKRFNVEVGVSDHTLGFGVSIASVAMGATVIEKHFTISRSEGGIDSAFSMEPQEMKLIVDETYKAWQALGKVNYGPTGREKASTKFRTSIYAVQNIEKNEEFTARNIRIIRPSKGLAPKYYDNVLGKKALRDIRKGTPMTWDLII